MKAALVKRLQHLEQVPTLEDQGPVEIQLGHLKKLPPEYAGERHVVTVGRDPDGRYQWEERLGLAPANEEEGNARRIIRLNLVASPHEELPAPASSDVEQS